MSSYASMKEKLEATGLYKVDSGTSVYAELKAYAAGLDLLFDMLDEMQSEYFIDTAETYGIVNRERFSGAVREDLSIEKRRETLKIREQTNDTSCTPTAFNSLLSSYGLTSFRITEYPDEERIFVRINNSLSENVQAWVRGMIENDFPAHLGITVSFA